uniref:Uncharacterized protein n=1 Tax=Arundo donax TaxID=35708 RepID=A0A0A9BM59_ARUDO
MPGYSPISDTTHPIKNKYKAILAATLLH